MAHVDGELLQSGFEANQPPVVDAGVFTISHMSNSSEGFEIVAETHLRRNQGSARALLIEATGDPQLKELSQLLNDDIEFSGVSQVRAARETLHRAEADEEASGKKLHELREDLETARATYVTGMAGKIGIRNLRQKGQTLGFDVQLVPYAFYAQFAKSDSSQEVLALSSLAGASMLLRTKDSRLIIQHRAVSEQRLDRNELTDGNRLYCDSPGASVAGFIDASIDSSMRVPGTPDPVDTSSIKQAILKEASEELGLKASDMGKLRIMGVAQDKVRPHDDFLLLADTHLTISEIRQKVRQQRRDGRLGEIDFEERFIDIAASPEAIETLLCEIECPLAPTHAALLLVAGYNMVLEIEGIDAAEAWKTVIERKVRSNYAKIDTRAAAYYHKYPEALDQVPERFWDTTAPPRNPYGYSPEYRPEEQGLSSFEDEMMRTGLLPDIRKEPRVGYLFDVDGPVTDPVQKRVIHPELLDKIATRLISGEPVGLNTGRATAWIMERVVKPLGASLETIIDRMDIDDLTTAEAMLGEALNRFCVIGEKGGDWVVFNKDGQPHSGFSQLLKTPDEVRFQIQALVEAKYMDSMFVDPLKRTMMTVEMNDGYKREEFSKQQKRLKSEVEKILQASGFGRDFKVLTTPIATDIESIHVGKALGALRIAEWMRDLRINPQRFLTFGDDESDMDMAKMLAMSGREVKFVSVGGQGLFSHDFTVISSPGDSIGSWRIMDNPHQYSRPVII
jgi:hypothetical protein